MIEKLVLSQRAFTSISRDCLKHPATETGGILVGQVREANLLVPFTVTAGPEARRGPAEFSPDVNFQQPVLDFLFEEFDLDYVGDWHRHPGLMDRPSQHDRQTARRIVEADQWRKSEAVFPIAVVDRNQVLLRAYLMSRGNPDFCELPFIVVPDRDPLMEELLWGAHPAPRSEVHHESISSHRGRIGSPFGRLVHRLRACVRPAQGK